MSFDQDKNESVTISGSDFSIMCDTIKTLQLQRDELLKALKRAVETTHSDKQREEWWALITKAKGEE